MVNHIRKGLVLALCLFVTICVTLADIRSSQRPSNTGMPARKIPNTRKARSTVRIVQPTIRINYTTGQLESKYGTHWYPIQWNSAFSRKYLKILCRSMGRPTDIYTAKRGPKTSNMLVTMDLTCSGQENTVSDCRVHHKTVTSSTAPTILLSCTGLSPRMKWGTHDSGLVATWYNSAYVPLCVNPNTFDNRGAQVVCQGLGLPSTHAINIDPNQFNPYSRVGIKVNLVCPNSNSPSSQCQVTTPKEGGFCSSYMFDFGDNSLVAVTCSDKPFEYRLTPVPGYSDIGRLEVRGAEKDWGTVCAENVFGSIDTSNHFAEVACKSLNLTSSGAHAYTDVVYGGNVRANLNQGICKGEEGGVGDCAKIKWGTSCEKGAYIGLKCSQAHEGEVRVTGVNGGLVQVYRDKHWKPINARDSSKRLQVATVVCRTLNLSTNVVSFKMSEDMMDIGFPSVHCSGEEVDFSQCNNTGSKDEYWFHVGKALYIQCDTGMENIRLEEDGLLKVQRNGAWGTVCGRDVAKKQFFSNYNASKICSHFNKPSSLASVVYKPALQRSGPISSGLKCNSTNQNISCTVDPWTNPDCGHKDDMFIQCDNLNRSAVQYRLKPGVFPNVGIFEISIDGVWGAVVFRDGDYIHIDPTVYCSCINNTL